METLASKPPKPEAGPDSSTALSRNSAPLTVCQVTCYKTVSHLLKPQNFLAKACARQSPAILVVPQVLPHLSQTDRGSWEGIVERPPCVLYQLGAVRHMFAWWHPVGAHGSHRIVIPLLFVLIDRTYHLRDPINWEKGLARSHQPSKCRWHQACGRQRA